MLDDFNREGLTIEVDLSLPAERVTRALDQVIEWRGKPRVLRCDNGPEYISGTLATWAEKHGVQLSFIQPGKSQQNAYIELYNRTVRYDWLGQYLFESIAQVQDHATRWLWTYNNERPNMALGGITPKMNWSVLPNLLLLTQFKNGGITQRFPEMSLIFPNNGLRSSSLFRTLVKYVSLVL